MNFLSNFINLWMRLFGIKNDAPKHVQDNNDQRSFFTAVRNQQFQRVQALIEKGFNINVKDTEGVTPLMLAAGTRNKEIVMMLLKNGANLGTRDNKGSRPLDWAIKAKNNDQIIEIIKKFPQKKWTPKIYNQNGLPTAIIEILECGATIINLTRNADRNSFPIASVIAMSVLMPESFRNTFLRLAGFPDGEWSENQYEYFGTVYMHIIFEIKHKEHNAPQVLKNLANVLEETSCLPLRKPIDYEMRQLFYSIFSDRK